MLRELFFLMPILCFATFSAHADTNPPPIETSKQFKDHTVYYNVFPSSDLIPAVATLYGIERAEDRIVINVSLRKNNITDGGAEAAKVAGTYSDLMTTKKLEFREIREPSAVYYIAQLRVSNRELLRFDISVVPTVPDGDSSIPKLPLQVTFTRKFAVDN